MHMKWRSDCANQYVVASMEDGHPTTNSYTSKELAEKALDKMKQGMIFDMWLNKVRKVGRRFDEKAFD